MKERLQQIPKSFLEFWNKYSSRQKTIIISVICFLFLAIGLLVWYLNKPSYVKLQVFDDVSDAGTMVDTLKENSIKYKTSSDGKTIYVEEGNATNALYLMGDQNLISSGMSWDAALTSSMSTTESEKSTKRRLALQNDIRNTLNGFSFVSDSSVFIDEKEEQYSILDAESTVGVSVVLYLKEAEAAKVEASQYESLANWLATTVGTDLEHVSIVDNESNNLYSLASSGSLGGAINSTQEYREKLSNTFAKNIENILLHSDFNQVTVSTEGLAFDERQIEELRTEYYVDEGREQGYPTNTYSYKSTGTSGAGGVPGTDPNDDDTDVMLQDGSSTASETTLDKVEDILTNSVVTTTKREARAIDKANSTLGIVAVRFRVYNEEDLEKTGQLEGMSFEEFVEANSANTPIEVTEEQIQLVAAASNIPAANIQILAYEQPVFQEKTSNTASLVRNILMIVLALLIIALLIFVVLRGTAPVEVEELEPELSVEQLLATTKENQSLEDIEFSAASETRKMIEKFVDENPEAVAQLLRNWLNEGW